MSWIGELLIDIHNWWNGTAAIKASLKKDENPLRIGVLSAAAINYTAIIDPVQTHPGVTLAAIAARSLSKAEAQIAKYSLAAGGCKAYGSYAELLADPTIDAVYIPLPNGLHAEWAIQALEAGKHVLIEKPIAANAVEVRRIATAARASGKVVLEAFHWRFHPAAHRAKALVESGYYGAVTGVWARMNLARGMLGPNDIRLQYGLAGGACMDLAYVFSVSAYFASRDITKCDVRILEAIPRLHSADEKIDEAMDAKFVVVDEKEQEDGQAREVTCHVDADLAVPPLLGFIPRLLRVKPLAVIELEKAQVEFENYAGAHLGHAITVREKDAQGRVTGKKLLVEKSYVGGEQWEACSPPRGEPWWSTYRYQLEAFVDMIRAKDTGSEYKGPWISLEESIKVMEVIDAVYEKAGLPRRGL